MADNRAGGASVAWPLFQAADGGSRPTSALDLWFMECGIDTAIRLNRQWHSRLTRVIRSNITRCSNNVCYVAEHDGRYYAAAIWTNPIARLLPQHEWLELRRMAISEDAPKNTATRMLAWMARDIRATFPDVKRLISYQDCDVHSGTIYRAAGWVPTVQSVGGGWDRPNRYRKQTQSDNKKQRWEKDIRLEAKDAGD